MSDVEWILIIISGGSVKLQTSSLGLQEKRIAIVPEEHPSIWKLVDGLNMSSKAGIVHKTTY